MKISVTKEHIALGQPGSACGCPVALALYGVIRPGFRPSVGTTSMSVVKRHRDQLQYSAVIPVPCEVADHIRRYDRTGYMDPFDFELELPESVCV